MTSDARAPATIGDYRVLRVLGRGGMGAVYLADDPVLDRRVAIKVIDGYRDHPSARARFLVEARAIARLNHPNVVAVYRAGEHDGEPYLVSEFVDGTPLDRLARPLDPAVARTIALGLARGLAAAHRQGILHRDVKPGNAIVGVDGTVKLLDFGLAKLAEPSGVVEPGAAPGAATSIADQPTVPDVAGPARAADPDATRTFTPATPSPTSQPDTSDLTVAGSRMGTPRYMAPEAWRGERLTPASDVFSLGLVLWELFGGRHPLAGLDGDALAAGAARVPSLATAAIAVAPAVVAVIDRAVAAAAAARQVDAGALADELEVAFDAPVVTAARGDERPARWMAVLMIAAGGAAVAGVAWVARPRGSSPVAAAAVGPALDAGGLADAAAPPARRVTAVDGCASDPVFLSGDTLAYAWRHRGQVEVMVIRGGAAAVPASTGADWRLRPTPGRHPAEFLYVAQRDDGSAMIRAHDLTIGAETDVVAGHAVVADYGTLYYLSAAHSGELWQKTGSVERRFATLPAQRPAQQLAIAPDHRHVAVVTGDDESDPGLCLVTLPGGEVTCPPTDMLQVGALAFAPDGGALYYPAYVGVRRLDLATGADTVAVADVWAPGGVAIHPDGTRLVRSECRSWGAVAAIGGGAPAVVLDLPYVDRPTQGPDGALALVTIRPGGGTRIVLWREGTKLKDARELASGDGDLGAASFSSDGARVAYTVDAEAGERGVRVAPVAGGDPAAWTTDAGDRDAQWLADGALLFTRLGATAAVWRVAGPGTAERILDDAALQDVDRARGRALVVRGERALGWLAVATRAFTPIRVTGVGPGAILAARLHPDRRAAIVLVDGPTQIFYRVDLATGRATVLHRLGRGDSAGRPGVLADGRVVFRAATYIGDLFEETGRF